MRKKLVLIQFSRALVPLLVMLFHLSYTMMVFYGFNLFGLSHLGESGGVYYFFALSGFMIYYVYRSKLGDPSQLKDFLLNRFIRIYPLYWILTLVLLPFLFHFAWYGEGFQRDPGVILASFFLIQNAGETGPVLLVAWSLVYTVFFYLVFSLLFFRKIVFSKAIIAVWAVLSFLFGYEYLAADHYISRFLFNKYNLMFLSGILCAYLITRYKVNIAISTGMIIVGLVAFPVMWLNSLYWFVDIGFEEGTAIASALLIFGCASVDLQRTIRIPSFLNYLGDASFSIYLSHILILDFLSATFEEYSLYDMLGGWGTSLVFTICMVAGGCFVHSYIEKPLHRILKQVLIKKKVPESSVAGGMLANERVKLH